MESCGDQPGDVRHVAEEERANLVRDLAKRSASIVRVGRCAADDQLRPVLLRQAPTSPKSIRLVSRSTP